MKNYETEQELNPAVDMLSLYTLRYICRMAEDNFDNLMEQKGLYDEQPTRRAGAGAGEPREKGQERVMNTFKD